eukprot:3274474-Rhodomonas_salina.2
MRAQPFADHLYAQDKHELTHSSGKRVWPPISLRAVQYTDSVCCYAICRPLLAPFSVQQECMLLCYRPTHSLRHARTGSDLPTRHVVYAATLSPYALSVTQILGRNLSSTGGFGANWGTAEWRCRLIVASDQASQNLT